jgi:hypothetical protein
MQQLYIKLRGAIFAETGYCLATEPDVLRKDTTAFFCTMGANGKPARIDPVPGCDDSDGSAVNIWLTPYPNPTKAAEALEIMCFNLRGAVDGDPEARASLIAGWKHMLVQGMLPESLDSKGRFAVLANVHGEGRVIAAMTRDNGSVGSLGAPDWEAMLDEALPSC